MRKKRAKKRLKTISLIVLLWAASALSSPAPAIAETTCKKVAEDSLAANGVDSQRQRRRVASELVRHRSRGRSAATVGELARRRAARVSRDQSWVNWAAWTAQTAYEGMEASQCKG